MKKQILTGCVLTITGCLWGQALAFGQGFSHGECSLEFRGVLFPGPSPYGGPDTRAVPVIFGEEFQVPELHMRFLDADSGKPLVPDVVSVRYLWLWMEYPYPEHPWGAWSDAQDRVKCTTGGGDELVVPEHTVRPHGWYDGKYTKFPYTLTGSKHPKFDRLEIVIESAKGAQRLIVKRRELPRYRGTTVVLKLPDAGLMQVEFVKRKDRGRPRGDRGGQEAVNKLESRGHP